MVAPTPDFSLARWRLSNDGANEGLVLALKADPLFRKAARRLSENTLAAAAKDRALDGMVKDSGRYSAASLAVYLDASGDLTLPRLKDVCAHIGLSSPGRARATLFYLRYLNYIEPISGATRATVYVPTPQMMNAWKTLTLAALDAAEIIDPGARAVSSRLNDPRFARTFIRIQGELALYLATLKYPEPSFWPVFLHRHAGMQVAHALMVSADPDDDYPPRGPLSFSITDLSRRFAVSRSHVMRMLKNAERRKLIARNADGTVALLDPARDAIRELLAIRLFTTLVCGERTLTQYAQQFESRAGRSPGVEENRPTA